MFLDEEARKFEREIRNPHHEKIRDVPTLKKILRDGLAGFEKSLLALSPRDRESAEVLYLQKVRKLTFTLHLAVITIVARDDGRKETTQEALQKRKERFAEESQEVAQLYRYL